MKKHLFSLLPIGLLLSSCATTPSRNTSQVVTTRQLVENTYQIETIASAYAYPTAIEVIPVENGLQIKGKVTHHIHKPIRTRGHVDIELVSADDQIIKRVSVPFQHQSGRPDRGHNPSFSVFIDDTVSKDYRIRVRHNIGTGDHQ